MPLWPGAGEGNRTLVVSLGSSDKFLGFMRFLAGFQFRKTVILTGRDALQNNSISIFAERFAKRKIYEKDTKNGTFAVPVKWVTGGFKEEIMAWDVAVSALSVFAPVLYVLLAFFFILAVAYFIFPLVGISQNIPESSARSEIGAMAMDSGCSGDGFDAGNCGGH